jgi:hypothetical protein
MDSRYRITSLLEVDVSDATEELEMIEEMLGKNLDAKASKNLQLHADVARRRQSVAREDLEYWEKMIAFYDVHSDPGGV